MLYYKNTFTKTPSQSKGWGLRGQSSEAAQP
jgi:hypothetical protein